MKNYSWIILLGVALTGASACKNPADDVAKATVEEAGAAKDAAKADAPAQPAAPQLPELTGINIGPANGTVGFVGSKVTGSHDGQFHQFSGVIDLGDGKPESAKVVVQIDVSSVKTDSEKLDGHLKSADFFDAGTHPKATFVSTAIAPGGADGATHTITGDLTLRGVTKSITFPATIAVSDEAVSVKSDFAINRKDFNIVYAGKADDLIRDEVVIKLDLKADRKTS